MTRTAGIPAPYWIVGLALLGAALGHQMGLADRTSDAIEASEAAPQLERD